MLDGRPGVRERAMGAGRVGRVVAGAVGLATAGALGLAVPAWAEATLTVTPEVVATDGTVSFVGAGCPAGITVNLDIWDTAGDPDRIEWSVTADSEGSFSGTQTLDNLFGEGRGLGMAAFCGPRVFDGSVDIAYDYFSTSVAAATVDVALDAETITYPAVLSGLVTWTPAGSHGVTTFEVDGVPVAAGGAGVHDSALGFSLPGEMSLPGHEAPLTAGAHTLVASFVPTAGGDAVEDSVDFRVRKAASETRARLLDKRIRDDQRAVLRVKVLVAHVPGPVGALVVKEGKRTVKKVSLKAGKLGVRQVRRPRLDPGRHELRVVFKGPNIKKSVSPTRTVRVRG